MLRAKRFLRDETVREAVIATNLAGSRAGYFDKSSRAEAGAPNLGRVHP